MPVQVSEVKQQLTGEEIELFRRFVSRTPEISKLVKQLTAAPFDSGQFKQLTEPPVEPGRFLTPEFLDIDGVRDFFGLKQSFLYRLLAENKIRAVSIRQRGKTRGRRLFDVASIRAFLNAAVDKEGDAQ
jgi:hypothetical protein